MSAGSIFGGERVLYYYDTVGTEGVVEQIWTGDGNSAPHGPVSGIFNGPGIDPLGIPAHINGAPDIDIIVSDWIDSTSNDPSNGTDQARWYSWIFIENDGTQLQDINGNSGETLRAWVASGFCSQPAVVFEQITDTTGGAGSGSSGPFVTLNKGFHFLVYEISDFTAFGGVQLQNDTGGDGIFSNYSGPVYTEEPTLSCRFVDCDYVPLENESFCLTDLLCVPKLSANNPTTIPSFNPVLADQSFLAHATTSGDSNVDGQPITLTEVRADAGWTLDTVLNEYTYTGTPDKVRIDAMVQVDATSAGALARISPELLLLKNGVVVAISSTGYQRHGTGHDTSSNTISYTDPNPGTNPVYVLQSREDSIQTEVLPIDLGHFSLDAIEKVLVREA